ncbi:RNA-binding domain-containing protein [Sporosarcina limicola]|uniref:HTH transcriptional regulator n=1 Tax=Sporosarcina limicola TaxID=34101 RepID=A0A927MKT6_9BACL|nr:RNA-binding domain-containing protein [Sporosarcina limicola]MBE1553031.1 putative HTH transcriptional regulator [Sporosarcina limicola]
MKAESEFEEWKDRVTPKLYREAISFANTSGGKIFIGISDNGEVVGLENPRLEEEKVINQFTDNIEPALDMSVQLIYLKDKPVIEITIDARGHVYRKRGTVVDEIFVRRGSTKRMLTTPEEIYDFIRKKRNDHFEVTLTDYDFNLDEFESLMTFVKKNKLSVREKALDLLENPKKALENYGAIRFVNEQYKLTQLGLWLSDRCSLRSIFLQYSGERTTSYIEKSLDLTGSIIHQLDSIEKLINDISITKINGLLSTPYRKFPQVAVREFLVNAFIHRDYRLEGDAKVTVYDNHLEIASTGGLYGDLTIETILFAARPVRRNPELSNVFYDLRLCERYASGVQRAMETYEEMGAEKLPEIREFKDSFWVSLPRLDETEKSEVIRERTSLLNEPPEEQIVQYVGGHGFIRNRDVQRLLDVSPAKATQLLRGMVDENRLTAEGEKKGRIYRLS